MFDSIRKHQSWLWTVIGFLVIVSFVWFFLPNTSSRSGGPLIAPVVGGKEVSQRTLEVATRQAQLGILMQFGPQIDSRMLKNFVREMQIYQYVLVEQKFKD